MLPQEPSTTKHFTHGFLLTFDIQFPSLTFDIQFPSSEHEDGIICVRRHPSAPGSQPGHILKETGITSTVGIGTNLYLAKVAMDIQAKKMPADKDGVRIAELNEDS